MDFWCPLIYESAGHIIRIRVIVFVIVVCNVSFHEEYEDHFAFAFIIKHGTLQIWF